MADNLQPMTATERKRALARWSPACWGFPCNCARLDELRMDGRSRARLMNGRVLGEADRRARRHRLYPGQRRREPGAQRRGAAWSASNWRGPRFTC